MTVKICDGLIGTTVIPGPSDVVTEAAGGAAVDAGGAAEEGAGAAIEDAGAGTDAWDEGAGTGVGTAADDSGSADGTGTGAEGTGIAGDAGGAGGAAALEGGMTVKSVTVTTGMGFSGVAEEASAAEDTGAEGSGTTADETCAAEETAAADDTCATDEAGGIVATVEEGYMVVNSVLVTNTTFGKDDVLAVLMATEDAKTIEDTTMLVGTVELSGRAEDLMMELAAVAEDATAELLSIVDMTADVEDRGADVTSEPAGADAVDDAIDTAAEDITVDEYDSEIIPEAPE